MAEADKKITVDRIGVEAHRRFIEKTKLEKDESIKKLIEPSYSQPQVLQTATKPSEIDLIFEIEKRQNIEFLAPPEEVLANSAFVLSLVPSLDTNVLTQKIESSQNSFNALEETERKALLKCINTLSDLNKILLEIQKEKDRYHKG